MIRLPGMASTRIAPIRPIRPRINTGPRKSSPIRAKTGFKFKSIRPKI